jgi:hypothetical protein
MAIPIYERQLGLDPIPGARVPTLPVAQGAGEAIGRGLQGFAGALAAKAEEFEDAETLEALNAFQRDVNAYHLDPEKGIYSARLGKDAAGAASAADAYMDGLAAKHAGKLGSPRASANFMRRAQEIRERQHGSDMKWELAQMDAYRDAEADASIGLALEAVGRNYADDEAVGAQKEIIWQALELKLRGAGDDARKAAFMEMEDRIGLAMLQQAVRNSPLEAEAWLEERKGGFSAAGYQKAAAYVEKEAEPYRIEALRDSILADFSDEGEAREFVKERFEGDFEKKVMASVEAEFADRRRIQGQREADAYGAAQDAVAGAASYGSALSAIRRSGLPPRLADALARQARSKFGVAGAGRVKTDPDDWVSAREEAMEFQAKSAGMTARERADAAKLFNLKYAGKVPPSALRDLDALFFSRPGAGGAGSSAKDPYNRFSPVSQVSKMAKEAGILDEAEQEMAFYGEFSKRAHQEEARLGRELTDEEVFKLGEKLTSNVVISRKNSWLERFVTGATGIKFDMDEVETKIGYQMPGNAEWDEERRAWFFEEEVE